MMKNEANAYHREKLRRGFERVINVQGSDHHGTVARVRAGLQALGLPAGYPEYVLHQMVRVEQGGKEVKIGKRHTLFQRLDKKLLDRGHVGQAEKASRLLGRTIDIDGDFDHFSPLIARVWSCPWRRFAPGYLTLIPP